MGNRQGWFHFLPLRPRSISLKFQKLFSTNLEMVCKLGSNPQSQNERRNNEILNGWDLNSKTNFIGQLVLGVQSTITKIVFAMILIHFSVSFNTLITDQNVQKNSKIFKFWSSRILTYTYFTLTPIPTFVPILSFLFSNLCKW